MISISENFNDFIVTVTGEEMFAESEIIVDTLAFIFEKSV